MPVLKDFISWKFVTDQKVFFTKKRLFYIDFYPFFS